MNVGILIFFSFFFAKAESNIYMLPSANIILFFSIWLGHKSNPHCNPFDSSLLQLLYLVLDFEFVVRL